MSRSTIQARLIADLLDGLRVFNSVDKLGIPEELLLARANNIATGLLGGYMVIPLPSEEEMAGASHYTPRMGLGLREEPTQPRLQLEVRTHRPAGAIAWHGWSCACSICFDAKQRDRS